jgi:hypothetical protein
VVRDSKNYKKFASSNRKKSPKMGLGLVCQNVFLAQTGVPYCELFIFGLCLCFYCLVIVAW